MPSKLTTLPNGLNPKQAQFAILKAEGKTAIAAYKGAGYTWKDKEGNPKKSLKQCASAVGRNSKVKREVDRIVHEKAKGRPGAGSHTVEFVRGEHLRQYYKQDSAGNSGEAFKHLQALGNSLGAYKDGQTITLDVLAVSEKLKQAALDISSVILTGAPALPRTHEDALRSTNTTVPILTLSKEGKLVTAKVVESVLVKGANPPRGAGSLLKYPPPTCISNLDSPYCYGLGDD